jgi:hypothetical protein
VLRFIDRFSYVLLLSFLVIGITKFGRSSQTITVWRTHAEMLEDNGKASDRVFARGIPATANFTLEDDDNENVVNCYQLAFAYVRWRLLRKR